MSLQDLVFDYLNEAALAVKGDARKALHYLDLAEMGADKLGWHGPIRERIEDIRKDAQATEPVEAEPQAVYIEEKTPRYVLEDEFINFKGQKYDLSSIIIDYDKDKIFKGQEYDLISIIIDPHQGEIFKGHEYYDLSSIIIDYDKDEIFKGQGYDDLISRISDSNKDEIFTKNNADMSSRIIAIYNEKKNLKDRKDDDLIYLKFNEHLNTSRK